MINELCIGDNEVNVIDENMTNYSEIIKSNEKENIDDDNIKHDHNKCKIVEYYTDNEFKDVECCRSNVEILVIGTVVIWLMMILRILLIFMLMIIIDVFI